MALGGIFGGGSEVQAPDYSQAVNTINAAGNTAAGMGVFKPVTVSTSFGTPQYNYDNQGRLISASYAPAEWLQDLQTGGQGLAGQYQNVAAEQLADRRALESAGYGYGAGQTLYGAANQALPTSYDIGQASQDYYNRMQQMVAPQREQQLATTRNNLFQRGRQGLAVGATQAGGMMATNPEMAAYYNAIAQQDLGLANQAEQQALSNLQQRQNMALGLFGAGASQLGTGADLTNAYLRNITAAQAPSAASLANLTTMENMAMSPIDLGIRLGTPTTQGMQYGGNMIFNAADRASQFQAQQAEAAARAANANAQQGGFWDALGGMAITAGLGSLTGGLGAGLGLGGSAATGGLFGGLGKMAGEGIFSSLNLGGGMGTLANLTPTQLADVTALGNANAASFWQGR